MLGRSAQIKRKNNSQAPLVKQVWINLILAECAGAPFDVTVIFEITTFLIQRPFKTVTVRVFLENSFKFEFQDGNGNGNFGEKNSQV